MTSFPPDVSYPKGKPRANHARVATSIALIGVVMSATAAHFIPIEAPAPKKEIPATGVGVHDVRIVDPAFCANQTWPYIDARCLKRADKPNAPVDQSGVSATQIHAAPAASLAAGQNATSIGSGKVDTTMPKNNTVPPVMAQGEALSTAQPQPPAKVDSGATDSRDAAAATAVPHSAYTYVTRSHHLSHWHHRRFIFGFRF